jgi:hypothetical protein
MEALFSLGFTFPSIIVRDYMFVAIVSKAAGTMRNGPSSYNETIEVGSFVMWFGVLICRTYYLGNSLLQQINGRI